MHHRQVHDHMDRDHKTQPSENNREAGGNHRQASQAGWRCVLERYPEGRNNQPAGVCDALGEWPVPIPDGVQRAAHHAKDFVYLVRTLLCYSK